MSKRIILGAVAILLVIAAAYAAFFIAPEERTMGLIQRIFYFHVASAWAGFSAFFLCFLGNLLYVWRRDQKYDWLAVSGAEVGLAFTTVVLITGPIWAHPVWGIWWTWDARLTSTFVLWLLYVSYLLLRTLVEEPDRRALLSSLFGIFAFLDVPLVFGAIRWWRTQHPQPVIMGGQGSGLDPTMKSVFFFSALAMHVLMIFLVAERYALEKMQTETDFLAREVEAQ
ncbi:MAG TPA: cytochrome c biogenesis protein CcsA [Candidatus Sulfotelmatobacter sp.]|jgi:heme exporter protein C|nr:cytochrome c biogenesis protein CcsA [Candidatus Sulfotelmatobacter sp.]